MACTQSFTSGFAMTTKDMNAQVSPRQVGIMITQHPETSGDAM